MRWGGMVLYINCYVNWLLNYWVKPFAINDIIIDSTVWLSFLSLLCLLKVDADDVDVDADADPASLLLEKEADAGRREEKEGEVYFAIQSYIFTG